MLEVERYSFFKEGYEVLRYSEAFPEKENHSRRLCNCTKSAIKKPSGCPYSVQQHLKYSEEFAGYNLSFNLSFGAWFTFDIYWDERPYEEGFRWRNPHASFRIDYNSSGGGEVKGCITSNIHLPGYGLTDCFFGNMYFGNKIDISRLMNGHSPSKIVKLENITDDQIWVHDCLFGKEAVEIFPEGQEAMRWKKSYNDAILIGNIIKSYGEKDGVKAIYNKAVNDDKLLSAINNQKTWLVGIVDNLKKTTFFNICDKVHKAVSR